VGEPHLDLPALTSRLLKVFGASKRPSNVTGTRPVCPKDLPFFKFKVFQIKGTFYKSSR
jgi:hypothetical protein